MSKTGRCWANTTKEDVWEEIVDIVVTKDSVARAYGDVEDQANIQRVMVRVRR